MKGICFKLGDCVLPKEYKKYFWDTEFEKLSINDNKMYIMARLFCFGDLNTLKWLYNTYSIEEIGEFSKKGRNLTPIVANYLRQKFNLNKSDMAYYIWRNSINYDWKRGSI